jgi:uncharacterized protein YqgV (UPF0045/DUF77 family)
MSSWTEMAEADTVADMSCALDIEDAAIDPLIGRRVQYRLAEASKVQCTDDGFILSRKVGDLLQLDFVVQTEEGLDLIRETVSPERVADALALVVVAKFVDDNDLYGELDLDQAAFIEEVLANSTGLQEGLMQGAELAEVFGLVNSLNDAMFREQFNEAMLNLYMDVIQDAAHGAGEKVLGAYVDAVLYSGEKGPFGDLNGNGVPNYADPSTPTECWENTPSDVGRALLGSWLWNLFFGSDDDDESEEGDAAVNPSGSADDCFPPIILIEFGWVDEDVSEELYGAELVNLRVTLGPAYGSHGIGW